MRTHGEGMLLLCACGLGLCLGCGPGEQRRALSGTVTFQGRPVEQGTITFLTTTGPPGPAGGALIQSGRYELPAPQGLEPGIYRVLLSAPGPSEVLTPAEIEAGASPRARELLPPRYNSASTLTIEVQTSGPNVFDFPLD